MTKSVDKVIYIDNHIIAVIKPTGLLTQTDFNNDKSLINQTRQWIKKNIKNLIIFF